MILNSFKNLSALYKLYLFAQIIQRFLKIFLIHYQLSTLEFYLAMMAKIQRAKKDTIGVLSFTDVDLFTKYMKKSI